MAESRHYCLVIPAYNESSTIRAVVEGALRYLPRVIVVDDGSQDGTAQQLTGLPVTVLHHARNLGKAASLWDGMEAALAAGATDVVTMDGDGQHDPNELPKLLRAAEAHPGQLVIGSRLWNPAAIPKARYRANRFANFWIAWASGQGVEDSQSGFRVYPAALLRHCQLRRGPERSFVLESEIIIEAAWRGFPCVFTPVHTAYPTHARPSHFRPVTDIARITRMVAWRLLCRGLYPEGLWRSLTRPPRRAESPAAAL